MTKNVTARIGKEFSKELEEIKDKRLALGIDTKRKSTKKLTNLIIHHDAWRTIKADTIEIKLEGIRR